MLGDGLVEGELFLVEGGIKEGFVEEVVFFSVL